MVTIHLVIYPCIFKIAEKFIDAKDQILTFNTEKEIVVTFPATPVQGMDPQWR